MFSSFSSSTSPTDRWKTTPILALNRTEGKGRRRKKRNVCIYRRSEEGKKARQICLFFVIRASAFSSL
jgi:hypothetical protein